MFSASARSRRSFSFSRNPHSAPTFFPLNTRNAAFWSSSSDCSHPRQHPARQPNLSLLLVHGPKTDSVPSVVQLGHRSQSDGSVSAYFVVDDVSPLVRFGRSTRDAIVPATARAPQGSRSRYRSALAPGPTPTGEDSPILPAQTPTYLSTVDRLSTVSSQPNQRQRVLTCNVHRFKPQTRSRQLHDRTIRHLPHMC